MVLKKDSKEERKKEEREGIPHMGTKKIKYAQL